MVRISEPFVRSPAMPPETAADGTGERIDLAEVIAKQGLFAVQVRDAVPAAGLASGGDYLVLRPFAGRADAWATVVAEVGGVVGLYAYVPRRASQHRPPLDAFRLLPRTTGGEPVSGPARGVRILGVVVGVLSAADYPRPD